MTAAAVRLLVVEDCDLAYGLIEKRLGRADRASFILKRVKRLDVAVEFLADQSFDAALLDLSLPDSSGLNVVEQIERRAPRLPLVVLTASDDRLLGLKALQTGAQDYLVKNNSDVSGLDKAILFAIERKKTELGDRELHGLRDAIQSLEHVFQVLSHELRSPLAAVRATSEMLLATRISEDDRNRGFIQSIHDETVTMSQLVDDLLEVARLSSGRVEWNWSTIDLKCVCHEMLRIVRPCIDADRVKLIASTESCDLSMCGDCSAITRLLVNLTMNALRHTERGSVCVRLREELEESSGTRWIEFLVEDTGSGIDPEVANQAGQPFKLSAGLTGSNYIEGSGLGLVICCGIAAAHGGSISVFSELGQGTQFKVRLRRDLPAPADPFAATGIIVEERAVA